MRSNDHFPDSGKPFRSARFHCFKTVVFVNNRATIRPGRGTYRLQAVIDNAVSFASLGKVLFAVTRKDIADWAPVAASVTNLDAEVLPVTGFFLWGASWSCGTPCGVEVDVGSEDNINFYSEVGSERIKIVQVGELPPRDSEVNDNHSGAFE